MTTESKALKKVRSIKTGVKHRVEELEDQFHVLQNSIGKARDNYVSSHQKELATARKKVKAAQNKVAQTNAKAKKAALRAKKTGSQAAKDQLKKARAASLLLGRSLQETKEIMVTARGKLHSAKPFDRKLAARAKVLAQFEKDWERKIKAEAAARASRAKKAAAKRKSAASKRAS